MGGSSFAAASAVASQLQSLSLAPTPTHQTSHPSPRTSHPHPRTCTQLLTPTPFTAPPACLQGSPEEVKYILDLMVEEERVDGGGNYPDPAGPHKVINSLPVVTMAGFEYKVARGDKNMVYAQAEDKTGVYIARTKSGILVCCHTTELSRQECCSRARHSSCFSPDYVCPVVSEPGPLVSSVQDKK